MYIYIVKAVIVYIVSENDGYNVGYTTNMYIARARCESQLAVGVEWAECSLIIGTVKFKAVIVYIVSENDGYNVGYIVVTIGTIFRFLLI